jgi:MFS family permease
MRELDTQPHSEAAGRIGRHDPYGALRSRDYRLLLTGTFIANIGMQMQTTAVGWEIYNRTGSAMLLGLSGLVQFLPVFGLVLLAGHAADRYPRRSIVMACQAWIALSSLGLAAVSVLHAHVGWMFLWLLLTGAARAFLQPARAALMPLIVLREHFSNAVTWSSGGYHLASVVGPALAGALIAWTRTPSQIYGANAGAALVCFTLLLIMAAPPFTRPTESVTLRSLSAGAGFLWRSPLVFGAIALDMFAVLFGGATALLPIYAEDLLKVGPTGFGWMRAAPAIGSLLMAIALAYRRPMEKAGRALFWAVAGFGLATIAFGISRNYWFSLVMLFLTGALDNISVVIRHTLVQMLTPDSMRGRVSAINSMFIGASNELGEFESGTVAHWFGPTIAVVSGGIGTLLVVAATAATVPSLRRYGRLIPRETDK